jgi:ankyrin repeat protein
MSHCYLGEGRETSLKLLQAHDDINLILRCKDGWELLSWAAGKNDGTATKLLQDRSNVNIRDKYGSGILSWAVATRDEALINLLLARS